jgi:hypothetical protein
MDFKKYNDRCIKENCQAKSNSTGYCPIHSKQLKVKKTKKITSQINKNLNKK